MNRHGLRGRGCSLRGRGRPLWAAAVEALEGRCLLSTVLAEGFEGSFPAGNGWTISPAGSGWGKVDYAFGGEATASGNYKGYCAGVGYNGTSDAPTFPVPLMTTMSRSINLAGLSNATLRFSYKAPSLGSLDTLYVKIDSTTLMTLVAGVTSWTQASFNLNAYLGGTHTLSFFFWSQGNVSGPKEGVYLDDISVTSDEPPTVSDRSPGPGGVITAAAIPFRVTFSEPVKGSGTGGVDATDLVLSGSAYVPGTTVVGTPTNPVGNIWEFPVSGLSHGTLNITLAPDAHDIEDLTGNSLASASWSCSVDLQSYSIIGMGTGTWNLPFGSYYHDARTQVIYLASEIGMSGNISSLAMDLTQVPGQTLNSFTIRMKQTPLSAYSSGSWDGNGWTTVYQKNETINYAGWNTFTFSTPFAYSTGGNLLVDFSFNNSSFSSDGLVHCSMPGGNRSMYYRTDSGYGDPLTWSGSTPVAALSASVPNVRLGIVPARVPPTGVVASDGSYSDRVRITWAACTGVDGYEVWRNTANDSSTATKITGSDIVGTTYDDLTAVAGTTYWYWVRARDVGGTSGFSESDPGYRKTVPSAPGGVAATDGIYSDRVRVSWTASDMAEGYEVWRSIDSDSSTAIKVGDVTGSSCDDLSATTGSSYYYWVRARNELGTSGFSAVDAGYVDRAPTAVALNNCSVSENQPAGTVVGVLSGMDPDPGQSATLTFSLVEGYGDNALFRIDPVTRELETTAVFDCATRASYTIQVRATDSGSPALTCDQAFTIAVTAFQAPPTLGELRYGRPNPEMDPQSGSAFGYAIAADGNLLVVGTPYAQVRTIPKAGCAYVFDLTTGSLVATLNNPTPGGDDWFGFSVAISGNTVVVGAVFDDTGATDTGAAYLFDATTGNLLYTLNDPSPKAGDDFGKAVAISGSTVVIGAGRYTADATDPGIAYLYDATTGMLLRTLSNPTPKAKDHFGNAVAVSGSTVVVGAPDDDTLATDAGAAYLFDANSGSLLRTLTNSAILPHGANHFGYSVAASDGIALVGATSTADGGEVDVFGLTDGAMIQTLRNPTRSIGDWFGSSVAIWGRTAVVGAVYSSTGASGAGCAYVFDAQLGYLEATLDNPAPAANDWFGKSVAIAGGTAIVGAYYDDVPVADAGTVYGFGVYGGDLLETIQNPTLMVGGEFGRSVVVSDNAVVVGAPGDNIVYVYDEQTGAALYTIANPTPAAGDNFGCSLAVSGSMLVVGAQWDDTGAGNAGSAYLFDLRTGNLLLTLSDPAPASSDYFGRSVALFGNTIVVGAPGGSSVSGKVYVFDAATGSLLKTLSNPTPAALDWFGSAVAISGNSVVVGAYGDDAGATDSGAAYGFDAVSGDLLWTLANPVAKSNSWFGYSVAVEGSTAVVGSPYAAAGGAAYVVDAATGAPLRRLKDPARIGGSFGGSVALSGSTVVVGATNNHTPTTDGGAAFAFEAATGNLLGVITRPTAVFGDSFGASVAVNSNTVVVGASGEDDMGYDRGALYVYAGINQAPTDVALLGGSIAENRPPGTAVGTFAGTDGNAGETLAYTLVDGDGAADNAAFSIAGDQLLAAGWFDYEAKNSYSIRVRATDSGGLWVERALTISVSDVDEIAPSVSAIAVDDGAAQRSMVRKLAVTFSEPVSLAGSAVAVQFSSGLGLSHTTVTVANPSGDQRSYVVTFSGAGTVGGSLADGIYDLVVSAAGVQDLAGNMMSGDYSQRFHRLFGDVDGNRVVNALDYAKLKATYGRAASDPLFGSAFDYEGNSVINALDLAQFRKRYGLIYSY